MIGHQIISFSDGMERRPLDEGLYAAEIYFGWKLLEWHDGAWWHEAKVGRWMAGDPLQWVGPLPERKGGRPKFDL